MSVDYSKYTFGGKGNVGKFIERAPKICAAGLPTAQPNECVKDCVQHYLLKDEVDALVSDAIQPLEKPRPLPPLRHAIPLDKRFAGPFGEVAQLMNPPVKTKFETLVEDLKSTPYSSYWKKPLGKTSDQVPMLPEGFNVLGTTFGKKTDFHGNLYDVILPKDAMPDKTPLSKQPGVQIVRNYCSPPYNSNLTFGLRTFVDKRGSYAKCCVTDDRIVLGKSQQTILNSIQSDIQEANHAKLGAALAPNENINYVPQGYSFGKVKALDNLSECLISCKINPDKDFYRKCLAHLNSLRKYLATRFLPTFFHKFYLSIKFFDKEKSGWLIKNVVYDLCASKFIRFNCNLIEPLLNLWNAFDGTRIRYKTLVYILNNKEPLPELPKIMDLPLDCLDFKTTYTEMVKPGQEENKLPMAGLPSGRYFDLDYPITPEKCSKADRICLPHESDVKACICPSILTILNVNHRDMYTKRNPDTIKRVFTAAMTHQSFTEEIFNEIYEEAKKYHSQGWVCYETFRRALENYKNKKE